MFKEKGFTLIELLIVVLIIGILAAIAVPQYNKAVKKSRAMQALILVRNIADSRERYFLETGDYPVNFSDLDIQVPAEESRYPGYNDSYAKITVSKDWFILMGSGAYANYVTAYSSGTVSTVYISYQKDRDRKIFCVASNTNTEGLALCQSLGAKQTNPPTVNCGWNATQCLALN